MSKQPTRARIRIDTCPDTGGEHEFVKLADGMSKRCMHCGLVRPITDWRPKPI
jgi:hypothetical protein